jgi:hypothetical protein
MRKPMTKKMYAYSWQREFDAKVLEIMKTHKVNRADAMAMASAVTF